MARSDLIINLVRAGSSGDKTLFRRSVEALIAEERAKQHHVLAERLTQYLQTNGSSSLCAAEDSSRFHELVSEVVPNRSLETLLLPEVVRQSFEELVEENQRSDLLRSYNLEPRHRILLVGPPGNGKTALAEALAEALVVPLLVVRYEGLIGSYLGETASRLAKLFEYVRTRRCVLFFDEFDVLGKERGDTHDSGEIKRVVSSLLLQIDALPSHVVVVTATNHAELLDRAVWRRFQLRLALPPPKRAQVEIWFERFEENIGQPLGYTPRTLATKLGSTSFAELEEFCADIRRRHVLSLPHSNLKQIVAERLKQWERRVAPSDSFEPQ